MKRIIFISFIMAAVFVYFITCENPIIEEWWEEENTDAEIEMAVPVIVSHPKGAVYPIGAPAEAMRVTATVSNGGKLSYQWYSNDTNSNDDGEIIQGATGTEYTPPTDRKGVTYYYVVVTNTISNGSEHKVTANAVSRTAGIGVDTNLIIDPNNNNNRYVIKITGLLVQNKVYDGTTAAIVTGTPVLNGITSGDDVTLVLGAAEFADASVGKNKAVILSGWLLCGADAGNYTLQMPNLMANITKADPVVNWPSGVESVFGRQLEDVKLPGNGSSAVSGTFAWVEPDYVTNFGEELCEMTFTPYDTLNYNTLKRNVKIKTLSLKMVKIPAGSFMMGSPNNELGRDPYEGPQRQVNLSSFYMSECEVTQSLFMVVMEVSHSFYYFLESWNDTGREKGTPRQLPVEEISWYDAIIFCNKLSMREGLKPAYRIPAFYNSTDPSDWGYPPTYSPDNEIAKWDTVEIVPGSNGYRLPTEAQWEYACRAGTTTAYNTGDTFSDDTGWHPDRTHKVGLKPANAWGLYDMHGNVGEYCWDWSDYYPSTPETDPVGPSSGTERVVRGGSVYNNNDLILRSAYRFSYEPYHRVSRGTIGFRVVRP